MAKILVVDDKQMMRDSVSTMLTRAGFTAVVAENGFAAVEMVSRHRPDAIVTDLQMPELDGIGLLGEVMKIDAQIPVVLMTAYASVDTAVKALKAGAFDYIQKPFEGDELIMTMKRAVEYHQLKTENETLKAVKEQAHPTRPLIGESATMKTTRGQIERIAASHGTVLVTGESGTGKEIVSQQIHALSPRRNKVLLCLNCAALSTTLLESELFGHEKGAFTGADQMRKGRFELADGGTLLLDEISEISPQVQAKLLRVLQERQFERVGSSETREVDVRIIATTNRDLEDSVAKGEFRQDLYFRLNVLPVPLPALHERVSDIPLLAAHFLIQQARRDGREAKLYSPQALELLKAYTWPGNVRELENICERAAVLTSSSVIDAETIGPWLNAKITHTTLEAQPETGDKTLEEIEREVIIRVLGRFDGHRQRTADQLGIGVRTLGLKLKKWKEENLVSSNL